MLRFLVVLAFCCSALFCRDKIVMFPPNVNEYRKYSCGDHPNPSVHIWSKIKSRLAAMEIDLIITEINRRDFAVNDPSVKWFFFHNSFSKRLNKLHMFPKEKTVFWIWEPSITFPHAHSTMLHNRFGAVFTFDDTLVNNNNYIKFYYPHNVGMIETVTPFKERRFVCLMNAKKKSKAAKIKWKNYYAERLRVIRFYERCKPGELHLYGRGWKRRPSAKGGVPNKIETIKNYKFCICYENTNTPGFVTEKIFDCFQAGVVPVYLGAENVIETIPENCFIDRRKFEDDEAVYQFMKAMDEKTYEEYLKNIREYLASEKGYLYTEEHFINSF
ncbi:MAG TPA: glycosyltransferase family 10, partial [Chlamydiales bacterium]|nr:glycosyltransferase family 10 [Chlamydiales bacterium]